MRDDILKERVHTQGKFICRRDFRCGGRDWKAGEEFRWRSTSVGERRVRQMWNARLIAPEEIMSAEDDARVKQGKVRADTEAKLAAARAKPEEVPAEPVVEEVPAVEPDGSADDEPASEPTEAEGDAPKKRRGRPKKPVEPDLDI